MGYEHVGGMLIEEALLRPTQRSTRYEKSRELARRKQAVTKTIYRVKNRLKPPDSLSDTDQRRFHSVSSRC